MSMLVNDVLACIDFSLLVALSPNRESERRRGKPLGIEKRGRRIIRPRVANQLRFGDLRTRENQSIAHRLDR